MDCKENEENRYLRREGVIFLAQHIIVTEWTPEWEMMFEKEAELIRHILGENCVAVHHIGSTAVPGLWAKPVIDMMPVVRDIRKVDLQEALFGQAGYEYLGEFGIPGRRYLRKGGDERTHQIHIFEESHTSETERHLAVRDYLRTHPEIARQYGELKKVLAEKFPYDIDGYCDGKDAFVKKMEREALEWRKAIPDTSRSDIQ